MTHVDTSGPEIHGADSGKSLVAHRDPSLKVALAVGIAVTVLLVGLFALLATQNRRQADSPGPIRVSGLPASLSTPLANLMALSPVPRVNAHDFTLTDQNGRTFSLTSFKGKAVVLAFMDPHCTDICPIISQELIDANHDLGARSRAVVFLAVNVNRFHTSVADMKKFTDEHLLRSVPSWHFLTGTPNVLKSIWAEYGVTVVAPSPTVDVIHSSFIFFIDAKGREKYLANPTDLHTAGGKAYLPAGSLSDWGRGIALVVKSMTR